MRTAFDSNTVLPHMPQESISLRAWEQIAQRAQAFAQAGQVEYALAMQLRALQVARRLLASRLLLSHPDHCMAAWVVSHHNISELLVSRNQMPLAIDYLCEAHLGLVNLIQLDSQADNVQQVVWRHLRETHVALLHWQRQHGSTTEIDTALRASVRESDAAVCRSGVDQRELSSMPASALLH